MYCLTCSRPRKKFKARVPQCHRRPRNHIKWGHFWRRSVVKEQEIKATFNVLPIRSLKEKPSALWRTSRRERGFPTTKLFWYFFLIKKMVYTIYHQRITHRFFWRRSHCYEQQYHKCVPQRLFFDKNIRPRTCSLMRQGAIKGWTLRKQIYLIPYQQQNSCGFLSLLVQHLELWLRVCLDMLGVVLFHGSRIWQLYSETK